MNNITNKISAEFLEELEEIINSSTIKTVEQIFGYKVESDGHRIGEGDIVVSYVSFMDGLDTIKFCYVYDQMFIRFLISKLYPLDKFTDEQTKEACEDTACELANIISNKIKYYMNSNGFHSVMELPSAETIIGGVHNLDAENIICVNFTSPEVKTQKNALSIGMVA